MRRTRSENRTACQTGIRARSNEILIQQVVVVVVVNECYCRRDRRPSRRGAAFADHDLDECSTTTYDNLRSSNRLEPDDPPDHVRAHATRAVGRHGDYRGRGGDEFSNRVE